MPPNRKHHQHQHNGAGHGGGDGGYNNDHHHNQARPTKCCVPSECFHPGKLIYLEDIGTSDVEVIKVACNNDHCDQGQYMHRECFETWEQTVLTYLRSCGRARSWSEKQRLQNLWTKRGYDLAFKACSCKCGKGHLRKDLDWIPPARHAAPAAPAVAAPVGGAAPVANNNAAVAVAAAHGNGHQVHADQNPGQAAVQGGVNNGNGLGQGGQGHGHGAAVAAAVPIPAPANGIVGQKKKKSKAKEQRPTLAISAPIPHPNNNNLNNNSIHKPLSGSMSHTHTGTGHNGTPHSTSHSLGLQMSQCGSLDFGLGASLGSSCSSQMMRPRVNSLSSNESHSSSGVSGSPPSPEFGSPINSGLNSLYRYRKNSKVSDMFGLYEIQERTRHSSSGLFSRRADFSSFNALPRHKLNSYHIKMEDESHGNDETRNSILAALISTKSNRISCVLCHTNLIIFDRYPLIDGTFFITPRQHTKACIEIAGKSTPAKPAYLSAVCMSCLEGWSVNLYCRCCRSKWDGSSLVLGTCYNYDIFAATPCCRDRLSCYNCKTLTISAESRPNFFSDYSQAVRCPHCGVFDYHLAKPLPVIFDKVNMC